MLGFILPDNADVIKKFDFFTCCHFFYFQNFHNEKFKLLIYLFKHYFFVFTVQKYTEKTYKEPFFVIIL